MPLSASETALNKKKCSKVNGLTDSASCCDCFTTARKRWSDTDSTQMSDVYFPGKEVDFSSPACLANMNAPKYRNLLIIESEIEFRDKKTGNKKLNKIGNIVKLSPKKEKRINESKIKESKSKQYQDNNAAKFEYYEVADDAIACETSDDSVTDSFVNIERTNDVNSMIRVSGKEELSIFEELNRNSDTRKQELTKLRKEHSIAQALLKNSSKNSSSPSKTLPRPKCINRFFTYNKNKQVKVVPKNMKNSNNSNEETAFIETQPKCEFKAALDIAMRLEESDLNGNPRIITERNYTTLPRMKKSHFHPKILYSRETNRTPFKVPKRTTADGTNIYYWCDVPKKQIKSLNNFNAIFQFIR